jgi:Flp pilus assembly protein TadG
VTIEAILILPLVLVTVLGITAAGRGMHAATMVAAAAHDAARAASIDRDPATARADATTTALASLHRGGTSCRTATVAVDTSAFTPGGVVIVRVTCRVELRSLALPGIPGEVRIQRSGRSPLDRFRGVRS